MTTAPRPEKDLADRSDASITPEWERRCIVCDMHGAIIAIDPALPALLRTVDQSQSPAGHIGQNVATLFESCIPVGLVHGQLEPKHFPIVGGRYSVAGTHTDTIEIYVHILTLAGATPEQNMVAVCVEDISARIRSETALRIRGRGLDASILPVALTDTAMTITYANQSLIDQWGLTHVEELLGTKVLDLWVPGEDIGAALKYVRVNGEWSGQLLGRKFDGSRFQAFASLSRVTDIDDVVVGYMVSCLDFSSQVRTEEELRRRIEIEKLISKISTDLLDAPPETLDNAMQEALAAVGQYAGVDRCFFTFIDFEARRYGKGFEWCAPGVVSFKEILEGKPITGNAWGEERLMRGEDISVSHIENLPPEAEDLKELFKSQGVVSNLTAPLIYGGALKGFLGFDTTREPRVWSRDLTTFLRMVGEVLSVAAERKQAHEELRRQMDLERIISSLSTRFINLDTDEIGQGIAEALDTLGTFMCVDRAYFNYMTEQGVLDGYEWCAPGVKPQPNALENVNFFEDLAWSVSQLAAANVVNIPNVAGLPAEAANEMRILQMQEVKSTVIVPVLSRHHFIGFIGFETVSALRTWNESTITMLTMVAQMFANAEERRRAEADRRRLEQQMRHSQKLESLGVLAGGIAHDFNNLLVGILGNAGIALLDLPEQSPVLQSIQHIEDAARHAAELTNQLLAYSGKGQFAVQPINISKLTGEMTGLLESVKSKKAVLKCHLRQDIPPIEADASQIKQIVMNLVTNASDAIGDQDGVISVTTGTCDADRIYLAQMFLNDNLPEGRYVFLEVSDTGMGMDGETLQKIFDPFFTTKFTGRGLGLAAVLGIVRSHGGAIRVESRRNEGTTFRVLLPCSNKPIEESPAPRRSSEWRGKGTVLVVDDEPIVRDVAKAVLERFGFSVMTACDGVECLDVYRKNHDKVNCILLDMTMPIMDGVEVCKALQKMPNHAPILLSSGYTELETSQRMVDLEVKGFIQKPYSPAALVEKIREALEEI